MKITKCKSKEALSYVYGKEISSNRLKVLLAAIAIKINNRIGQCSLSLKELITLTEFKENIIWESLSALRERDLIEFRQDTSKINSVQFDIKLIGFSDWLEQRGQS